MDNPVILKPAEQPPQPTQSQTINLPTDTRSQDGFPPVVKWVIGTSIISIFLILYVTNQYIGITTQKEMIKDLKELQKEDRKSQMETADRAHRQFLEDAQRRTERSTQQWETVRTMTEEVKRGNQLHAETQKDIKELIIEVKKIKMGGGAG